MEDRMQQSVLAVFDLDGTLLNSPAPKVENKAWWYDARSLDGIEPPGFDPRWNLGLIQEARRLSMRSDENRLVLCTGRPETKDMKEKIMHLVYLMDIPFHHVQLKPVLFGGTTSEYKALAILDWAEELPNLKKVRFWDDDPANHADVASLLREEGIPLEGYRIG